VSRKKPKPAPAQPKPHGKFIVWHCCRYRTEHCWHRNRQGLRDRCCWCGDYRP